MTGAQPSWRCAQLPPGQGGGPGAQHCCKGEREKICTWGGVAPSTQGLWKGQRLSHGDRGVAIKAITEGPTG